VEIGKLFQLEMSDATRRAILWDTPASLFGGL
jgi:hypothetical protein